MGKKPVEKRLLVYLGLVIAIFLTLVLRLGYLQLLKTESFQTQSEQNRINLVPIAASRGNIIDRGGVVLASSRPVYTVTFSPFNVAKDQVEGTIQHLAAILNDPELTAGKIQELLDKQTRASEPVVIKRLIPGEPGTYELLARIEERRQELPGVTITVEPMRYYPKGNLAGHMLGYVREISPEELKNNEGKNYRMGDLYGNSGLEKTFEEYLRGTKGAEYILVNARGRRVGSMASQSPVQGNQLALTIDYKLQQTMEKALDDTLAQVQKQFPKAKAGAAVAIDVRTGAILAMASRPSLNPNDMVDGVTTQEVEYYYRTDPLVDFNRAIQGTYAPGSTFKPITGMAAMLSGNMTPQTIVNCTGAYWRPPYIKCWGVHGRSDLTHALAISCNTYFQEAGYQAGKDRIIEVAHQFGLGEKTGIELPWERKGLLPTPEWKMEVGQILVDRKYKRQYQELDEEYTQLLNKVTDPKEKEKLNKEKAGRKRYLDAYYKIDLKFNTEWQQYETLNMSIGQGSNSYTPLQLANYIATLANGGKHYKPYLVQKIVGPDNKVVKEFKPQMINQVEISTEAMAAVREGMRAVAAPGGTASFLFRNFPPNIAVAAKTGTAQPGRQGVVKNKDYDGLFVAFAPYDKPQIAFAGVIEFGYHGGTSAGLVAKAVFEQYFGLAKDDKVELPSNPAE